MKLAVCTVIIGIAVAAAEPIVLEYRKVIETRVQADTYIALRRRDTSTSTSTCPAGKELCSASNYPQINSCIPASSLCCDYTFSVGYCPTSARCGSGRFPGCFAPDSPTLVVTVVAPSTTPVASVSGPAGTASGGGSGAPSTGLPTGSIVGISVSVACSVIGLVFGIGFKIWKHKRKEKLGNAPAVA